MTVIIHSLALSSLPLTKVGTTKDTTPSTTLTFYLQKAET